MKSSRAEVTPAPIRSLLKIPLGAVCEQALATFEILVLIVYSMVCCKAAETNHTVRLKNYTLQYDPNPTVLPTITQAAMATSAAVSFFDPVVIGHRTYLDGGLGSNNPVDEVEDEACEIWCRDAGITELQRRTKCFLSVGTGHPGVSAVPDKATKFILKTLTDMATETETRARMSEGKWRQQFDNKNGDNTYFRFNVEHGLADVGLEEYRRAPVIETATELYLKSRHVQGMLDRCTKMLNERQCVYEIDFS